MSHTFKSGNTTFIHNPDYSGNVKIVADKKEITVKCTHLIKFVAEFVRKTKIENLKNKDFINLLCD
ncbi:MAG: hypothetical protein ACYSTS_19525 [Planctomycetota bacterium]